MFSNILLHICGLNKSAMMALYFSHVMHISEHLSFENFLLKVNHANVSFNGSNFHYSDLKHSDIWQKTVPISLRVLVLSIAKLSSFLVLKVLVTLTFALGIIYW